LKEKSLIQQETGFEVSELKAGSGCALCNFTGYRGRTGVFEVLEVNKTIRTLIENDGSYDDIRDAAIKNGMLTMRKSALIKVTQGLTTLNEAQRVVAEEVGI
jgi:type IV pilus assembly protein PilB